MYTVDRANESDVFPQNCGPCQPEHEADKLDSQLLTLFQVSVDWDWVADISNRTGMVADGWLT